MNNITYHINIVTLDRNDAVAMRKLNRQYMKERLDEAGVDNIGMTVYREFLKTEPVKIPKPSDQKLEVAV